MCVHNVTQGAEQHFAGAGDHFTIDKGIGRGIKQLQAHPSVLLVNPHVKILIRLKNGFSVIDVGAGVENSQYTLTKKRVAAARANLTQLLNFTLG